MEILNDNGKKDFFLNLETFQKESSNSELYPTTVRIGAAIGIALMAAVSIALVTLVSIGLFNLITLSAFAVFLATPEIYSAFDDVYEAKEKGKVIYGFFSDRKTNEKDIHLSVLTQLKPAQYAVVLCPVAQPKVNQ